MAKLISKLGHGSASVDGETFSPDDNGVFTVPDGKAAYLLPHGFGYAPTIAAVPSDAAPAKKAKAADKGADDAAEAAPAPAA